MGFDIFGFDNPRRVCYAVWYGGWSMPTGVSRAYFFYDATRISASFAIKTSKSAS